MNIHLQVWMEMLSFLLGIRREKIDCERKKGERNIYMEVLSKVKWSTILFVDFSKEQGSWLNSEMRTLGISKVAATSQHCISIGVWREWWNPLGVAAAGKNDLTQMWKATFPSMFIATKRTMYWKLNITRFSFQFKIKCACL